MKENPVKELLQRPEAVVMGIINVTPDSFSDGGLYLDVERAVEQGLAMVSQGAGILDVGGESTRPGADGVSLQKELDRVIPVIEQLVLRTDAPISVDTSKLAVMEAAVSAGATMINDVNALQANNALQIVAGLQVPVCVMHKSGDPKSMQQSPDYGSVVTEVMSFLQQRINCCVKNGIPQDSIIIDPGIGFGKTLTHNLKLLAAVPKFKELGCDILIGVSRKSMIDHLLTRAVDQRLAGSIGLAVQSVMNGAKIVRVHDVRETSDAIRCIEAVISQKNNPQNNK